MDNILENGKKLIRVCVW